MAIWVILCFLEFDLSIWLFRNDFRTLAILNNSYFLAYNMVACRITDARNGGNATDSQVPLKK